MFIHVYEYSSDPPRIWFVAAFSVGSDKKKEMQDWCRATFGRSKKVWVDGIEHGEIMFRDPRDLDLFLLRWN